MRTGWLAFIAIASLIIGCSSEQTSTDTDESTGSGNSVGATQNANPQSSENTPEAESLNNPIEATAPYTDEPAQPGNSVGATQNANPQSSENTPEAGSLNNPIEATAPQPVNVLNVQVANWKNNAKAAYSIIHDDYCSGQFSTSGMVNNWRELSSRGLVAGYGVVTSFCNPQWYQELHLMADAGMEVINHTYSHKDLRAADTNYSEEMGLADEQLHDQGFHDVSYFAYPFDHATEDVLRETEAMGYQGARGGGHGLNSANLDSTDELAPFKTRFDCFNLHQAYEGLCSKYKYDDDLSILNAYLDDAIENKSWALRELHGIGVDDSWGWVSEEAYRKHLQYVKTKVDDGSLWMGTPTNVTRYWAARHYCGTPTLKGNTISYDSFPNAPGCIEYATELSLIVDIASDTEIQAQSESDSISIPVKKLGAKRFLIPIDPIGDKVVLKAVQ